MKFRIGLFIITAFFLSGCSLTSMKSGIEIISYPTAKVYIDGKEAGMTPYKNNTLKPGELDVRLVAGETEWSKKIHLENGANTVINRELANGEDQSGGYVLYFEATGDKNKAGMLISSKPDRSTVAIDDEIVGYSPLRLENVGEGDKKLVISFPGHKSISSFVKFVNGYQLVINADLPIEEVVVAADAVVTVTPPMPEAVKVLIKTTETGWLRVRSTADTNGIEIAKVNTAEKYPLIEEKIDWFKIDLGGGKNGWISAKYAEKLP